MFVWFKTKKKPKLNKIRSSRQRFTVLGGSRLLDCGHECRQRGWATRRRPRWKLDGGTQWATQFAVQLSEILFFGVCFPVCLWQQINKRAALASEMHPCGHWSTLRSAVGQRSLSTVNRSCLVVFSPSPSGNAQHSCFLWLGSRWSRNRLISLWLRPLA